MITICSAPDPAHLAKCELAAETLRLGGRLRLQVNGLSMVPTIWPGDMLVIERAGFSKIENGEIVLFFREQRLFAHRVINCTAGNPYIATQGDAMPAADAPVSACELLGKVVFVGHGTKCMAPRKKLLVFQRIIATVVAHSQIAARLVLGVYWFFRSQSIQLA